MKKRYLRITSPALAVCAVLTSLSSAHAHHAEFMSGKPFLQGLSMPVHGLDHLLSAVAVGLVAAQAGGRLLRWLPVLFSVLLLAGGCLNLGGISLPDLAVPAAAVLLGGVLCFGKGKAALVAVFAVLCAAVFNGQALLQGPSAVSSPLFAVGCLGSALALCGLGFGVGRLLQLEARPYSARLAGAAVVAAAGLFALLPEWNGSLIQLIEGTR